MVTRDLPRTVSEINGDFGQKSQISPSPAFNVACQEFSLEFCNGGSVQKKSRAMPLPEGGKMFAVCAFVLIQYLSVPNRQTDRQTDRQTWYKTSVHIDTRLLYSYHDPITTKIQTFTVIHHSP